MMQKGRPGLGREVMAAVSRLLERQIEGLREDRDVVVMR